MLSLLHLLVIQIALMGLPIIPLNPLSRKKKKVNIHG